jgi:hypothetical protein
VVIQPALVRHNYLDETNENACIKTACNDEIGTMGRRDRAELGFPCGIARQRGLGMAYDPRPEDPLLNTRQNIGGYVDWCALAESIADRVIQSLSETRP